MELIGTKTCEQTEMLSKARVDFTKDPDAERLDPLAKNATPLGVDPNQVDKWANTPLYYAKTAEQTEMLLAAGADPNQVNRWGNAPLYYARTAEQTEVLLKAGADPNHVNECGTTPLHLAVTVEQKSLLENYKDNPKEVRAAYIIQNNYRKTLSNKKLERIKKIWFRLLETIKYHPTFIEDPKHRILGMSARKDLLEMGLE